MCICIGLVLNSLDVYMIKIIHKIQLAARQFFIVV